MNNHQAVKVRRADPSDGAALAALRWEFSKEDGVSIEEAWEDFQNLWKEFWRKAEANGWVVWVAERDGHLLGNMWVQLVERVPRPGNRIRYLGYLTNVYVKPEARGQDVGSRILAEVIAWAKTENLELLFVWPSSESVEFYQRAGFSIIADAQGPGEQVMELHLH